MCVVSASCTSQELWGQLQQSGQFDSAANDSPNKPGETIGAAVRVAMRASSVVMCIQVAVKTKVQALSTASMEFSLSWDAPRFGISLHGAILAEYLID